MSNPTIYQKIESIYATESGKKFISHLIREFFPIDKATFMFGFEEDKKRTLKCCITGDKTYTKDDLFQHVTSAQNKQVFMEHSNNIKVNLSVISQHSDKVISQKAWHEFFNFVMIKLMQNDGHISWLLRDLRSKEIVDLAKKEKIIQTPREEKLVKKNIKGAKLTFEDNEVLLKLKQKMLQND